MSDATSRGVFRFALRGETLDVVTSFRGEKLTFVFANPPDNKNGVNGRGLPKLDGRKIVQIQYSQAHGISANSFPIHSSASNPERERVFSNLDRAYLPE